MTWVLVRKLLRDLRPAWSAVALLLFAFLVLWARITSRITGEILVAFQQLGISVDTIRNLIFQGPGQVIQAIIGGTDIHIESAGELMTVAYVHPLTLTLLCLYAVGRAAGAIAGEIDRGTMELLLAQPIRRSQVIAAHVLVDVLSLPPLCLVLWLGTWAGAALFGGLHASQPLARVEPWRFAPALLAALSLVGATSGLTLWLSALGRSRMRVWGSGMLLLVVLFLLNVVGQLWEPLEWVRRLTLFYYYQPQEMILKDTWYAQPNVWGRLAVLGGIGAAGYLLAWWTFCKRDLPAPL
jgi:ABC-2 type transport system permease protein